MIPPNTPHPTEPLSVKSITRIKNIGAKIINKFKKSCNPSLISSVSVPIACMFCFRDWKTAERKRQKK